MRSFTRSTTRSSIGRRAMAFLIMSKRFLAPALAFPAALALFVLASSLLSCGGGEKATGPVVPTQPTPTVATVTLSPDTVSIRIGAQTTVVARARTSTGVEIGNATITWTSNDSTVAAVNQMGTVSAKRFGPAIITAATAGVSGIVRIQVLAPTRDSTTISATDTTRVITGLGSSVTVAPNASLSGQRLVVEETAPPAGTNNPLGPTIKVSFAGSLAGLRASASANPADLSLTVSTVTSVPSGVVAQGESRVAFLLSGGSTLATSSSPLLRVSDFETPSTSGTGAATLTSSMKLTTAGSTPMVIVPTSAPPSCSQTDFPDGERLYRIRTAPASVGPAPFALVLVHGWQPTQLKPPLWNCETAAAWRPAEDTWSTFLSRFYPADGSPGEAKRLQLFDVWIAHYPSHSSIQSNGDALARLIAQQIPSKRIVVLAHSMGGLVTAAALRASPGLAIDTIVSLGTPWRGTPIPGGLWILSSGWSCATISGSTAGAVAAGVATLTEGSRGLSDVNNGYLQTTLRSTINTLAPRITAVGGNIRSAHLNPALDGQYLFYAFGDCVLKDLGYNGSDGVVPTTSVTAEGQISDFTIISGLDHSQLYAAGGQADPLGIAVDRFLAYLDHHAPVASLSVAPATASIAVGATQQFTATLKDATGGTLTNRPVSWSSSNPSVATVNGASGLAAGVAVGTTTITGASGGQPASVSLTVTPPVNLVRFTAISVHALHTCGLSTSGSVYCWGGDFAGTLGRGILPLSTTDCKLNLSGTVPCVSIPTPVEGGLTFTSLATTSSGGVYYSCAGTPDRVYCWGGNSAGEIGNGAAAGTFARVPTAVASSSQYASIAVGGNVTCGIIVASSFTDCWGDNSWGQLADPQLSQKCGGSINGIAGTCSTLPHRIPGALLFTQITIGSYHSCALSAAGVAYCWGYNSNSQIGAPAQDVCWWIPDLAPMCNWHPTTVETTLRFTSLAAGSDFTCGVSTAASVYCWGRNEPYGQLGTGSIEPWSSMRPLAVANASSFAKVFAGYNHACALDSTGAAYCWGRNFDGQLGDGSTTDRWSPVRTGGSLRFTSLSLGVWHTCGIATDGYAYCWGFNGQRQLGNDSPANALSPVKVEWQ